MKKYKLPLSIVMISLVTLLNVSCNDEEPKTIPEVTTSAISNITTTTASGGGEIVSDGNTGITVSGLVYSSSNNTPTLADSKTEEDATGGVFTSELEGLTSGSQYYVRAYATNNIGTGYGEVVTFSTGNAAPTVINISITGAVRVPEILTATYTYSDPENNAESGTTVQWYKANDGTGAGETAIAGATTITYTLKAIDEFKYIRVGIKAKAATGTTDGTEVKSSFVGPVAEEPTTVSFTYNGQSVTYGILISPTTGRRWLDRNLGAPNTPSGYDDFANYGDMFQWGRGADGHQLINRSATSAGTTGVNGTTAVLSSSDAPGNGLFILSATAGDWRNPKNDNLWQGVNGINNPCPSGWRLPTLDEWLLENISLLSDGYTKLKLTAGGERFVNDGSFSGVPSRGAYWSSSTTDVRTSLRLVVRTTPVDPIYESVRGNGSFCRCIKN